MRTVLGLATILSAILSSSTVSAGGRIDVRIDESTLQQAVDRLWDAKHIPHVFGDADSVQGLELRCLAPHARFARADYGETLDSRMVLSYACAMRSARYSFNIQCPYSRRQDVPTREWDPRSSDRRCPMIQVSLYPIVETSTDGTQSIVFRKLTIDRLDLFTEDFSPEIAETSRPVVQRLIQEMNQQFEQFGNPWFRSLTPFPVALKEWKQDFKRAGHPVKSTLKVKVDQLLLDADLRQIRIGASVKSEILGGKP